MAELPRMTQEEIDDLARRVVVNEVFLTNTADAYRFAFPMLMIFGGDKIAEFADDVGAMWEELSKAGPRSINGYPFFTSGHFVHREDFPLVLAAIERKEAGLRG